MTYFCPALDPPLDGSGRKTTTLVRDLEYFIHTKFHKNPSSGAGEEVENVNSLTDDGRDAGQRVITIGHWSLWLLCPKKMYVALAVFQPYRDLEAGDNQSLIFKWRDLESNPGPLAPQAKSLTTRPPQLPHQGLC